MTNKTHLTEILTRFVLATPAAEIPQDAIDKATANIVDTVGCILAGSNSEVREPLEAFLRQEPAQGTHVVAGTNLHTSAALAALLNGTFGHALDFDDVLSMMPAHPSAVVLPSLFTALDGETSGAHFLDAYVIGIEVGARLGLGISNGHYRRGFHATGTLAIFSAIAALGRLLRLDAEILRTAFGIGASMSSGVRCNFGTMTKPFHAGWAAHNAVHAVRLARVGFSANTCAFEAKAGFFDAYGTEQSDLTRVAEMLGKPFVVATPGLALKKFPCIYLLHRPIDALIGLRERLQLTPDNVEFIECRGAPGAFLPLISKLPETGLEGKFSLEYVLAVGAIDGRYNLSTFSNEAVRRPVLKKLYPRMRRVEDVRCLGGDSEPQTRSAGSLGFIEVTVARRDGLQETVRIERPPGAPERPLTWDDLRAKFFDCGRHAGMPDKALLPTFDAWRNLGAAPVVQPLIEMLAKG